MNECRTSLAYCLSILIFACFGAWPARADAQTAPPSGGEWWTKDFKTSDVTPVQIRQQDTKLSRHMWGRCHPTECDWGDAAVTHDWKDSPKK